MIYKIILSEIAISEEANAYLYYESQSEDLGEKFLDDIQEAPQKIILHPTYYG